MSKNVRKHLMNTIFKLGISVVSKHKKGKLRNYNNYIIGTKKKKIVVNLDLTLHSVHSIYLYIQRLTRKNGKILFIDRYFKFSKLLKKVAYNNSQYYVTNDEWIGGTLTNFIKIKWFYYLRNVNIGYRVPEAVVTFDNFWSSDILSEAYIQNIPVVGDLSFTGIDKFTNYFIVGNLITLNSVLFFTKLLDLAIKNGRSLKLKMKMKKRVPKYKRVYMFFRWFNMLVPKKKRRFKKKRGVFIRTFFKQIVRVHTFRRLLKKNQRRLQLTKKLVSFYYNWTRTYTKKPRTSKKIPTVPKRRVSNKLQVFLSGYERRLLTVLYRLNFFKDRILAKKAIENNWVFVNNKLITKKNWLIKNNDVIRVKLNEYSKEKSWSFLKKWRRYNKKFYRRRRVGFRNEKLFKEKANTFKSVKIDSFYFDELIVKAQPFLNKVSAGDLNRLLMNKTIAPRELQFGLANVLYKESHKPTTAEILEFPFTKKERSKELPSLMLSLFFLSNLPILNTRSQINKAFAIFNKKCIQYLNKQKNIKGVSRSYRRANRLTTSGKSPTPVCTKSTYNFKEVQWGRAKPKKPIDIKGNRLKAFMIYRSYRRSSLKSYYQDRLYRKKKRSKQSKLQSTFITGSLKNNDFLQNKRVGAEVRTASLNNPTIAETAESPEIFKYKKPSFSENRYVSQNINSLTRGYLFRDSWVTPTYKFNTLGLNKVVPFKLLNTKTKNPSNVIYKFTQGGYKLKRGSKPTIPDNRIIEWRRWKYENKKTNLSRFLKSKGPSGALTRRLNKTNYKPVRKDTTDFLVGLKKKKLILIQKILDKPSPIAEKLYTLKHIQSKIFRNSENKKSVLGCTNQGLRLKFLVEFAQQVRIVRSKLNDVKGKTLTFKDIFKKVKTNQRKTKKKNFWGKLNRVKGKTLTFEDIFKKVRKSQRENKKKFVWGKPLAKPYPFRYPTFKRSVTLKNWAKKNLSAGILNVAGHGVKKKNLKRLRLKKNTKLSTSVWRGTSSQNSRVANKASKKNKKFKTGVGKMLNKLSKVHNKKQVAKKKSFTPVWTTWKSWKGRPKWGYLKWLLGQWSYSRKRMTRNSYQSRKWKKKTYPRHFIFSKRYGVAIYLYTPNAKKILLGRFLTLKRLKMLTQFSK